MAEVRVCEQCGEAFQPRREHARFCSARCRIAWNTHNTMDLAVEASALDWSIIGMRDTIERLRRIRPRDPVQAASVVSEAVWWVTIVDATLVRYFPEAYDGALSGQAPAEREGTEETFAGLRFVRNWGGYHTDTADFIQPPGRPGPAGQPGRPARLPAWTWRPLPEPALGSLPPRGRAWEMTRYRAYQARLAGRGIGETFGLATAFLHLAYAAAGIQQPAQQAQSASVANG